MLVTSPGAVWQVLSGCRRGNSISARCGWAASNLKCNTLPDGKVLHFRFEAALILRLRITLTIRWMNLIPRSQNGDLIMLRKITSRLFRQAPPQHGQLRPPVMRMPNSPNVPVKTNFIEEYRRLHTILTGKGNSVNLSAYNMQDQVTMSANLNSDSSIDVQYRLASYPTQINAATKIYPNGQATLLSIDGNLRTIPNDFSPDRKLEKAIDQITYILNGHEHKIVPAPSVMATPPAVAGPNHAKEVVKTTQQKNMETPYQTPTNVPGKRISR
ncbi:hypothetical protein [Cupriavidus necator]